MRVLGVFAHPDDETFRCGGTLALLARQGVQVHVLTATRGGSGSCGDPPLCSIDELPAWREEELRCACAALGIEPPLVLDYMDGHVSDIDPDLLTAHILNAVHMLRPDVLLSFGLDGLSGHPDHIAVGRCAAEVFRQTGEIAALYTPALPYSVMEHFGLKGMQPVPDEKITLAVNIMPVWESKLAAIHCHATQHNTTPILLTSSERQQMFFGTEYFVRAGLHHAERDWLWRLLHEQRH